MDLIDILIGTNLLSDPDAIDLWMSDTLRAYNAFQGQGHEHQAHKEVTKSICALLCKLPFKEPIDWERKCARFTEQIVKPAAGLSLIMSCSSEQYQWEWYFNSRWYYKAVVSKCEMNNFTIMDALTHQIIRTMTFENLPDNAKIGGLLLVISPALFRYEKLEKKVIQIEKAVILICVTVDASTHSKKTPSNPSRKQKKETKKDDAVEMSSGKKKEKQDCKKTQMAGDQKSHE